MPCFLACEAPKTAVFTVFFGPEGFQTLAKHRNVAVFGALRASLPSSTTVRQQAFELFFCFIFFCRCWCGDALYTDTLLQTDDLTHSSLFMHRRLYTQTLLHRETFAQNSFYTKKKSFPPRKKQANMCLSLDLFVS